MADDCPHLNALVRALVAAGNKVVHSWYMTKSGPFLELRDPIDFGAIRDVAAAHPTVSLDDATDGLSCEECWAEVMGGARVRRNEELHASWQPWIDAGRPGTWEEHALWEGDGYRYVDHVEPPGPT